MEVRDRTPSIAAERGRAPRGGARRGARRAVLGALAGGLAMFAVAAAMTVSGRQIPVLGAVTGAAQHVTNTITAAAVPTSVTPGSCLAWRRPDASDAHELACASPHLFELAAVVQLRSTASAPFPDDTSWGQIVDASCTPVVTSYLHGRFDPHGRYRIGALKPTRRGWTAGDRVLRCGLQSPGQRSSLFPSTGHVSTADQSDTHPAGTCLGLDATAVGDPVDCAGPHAAEAAGIADLASRFTGKTAPSVADQDGYLQPTCTKIAADYLGGAGALADRKLTVYWPNLAPESWAAGTRRVDCNLAAQLPRGAGFAPLTGSARRQVTVGSSPPASSDTGLPPDAPTPDAPGTTPDPSGRLGPIPGPLIELTPRPSVAPSP